MAYAPACATLGPGRSKSFALLQLAPIAKRVLTESNAVMLAGYGNVTDGGTIHSHAAGLARERRLVWAGQRSGQRRARPAGVVWSNVIRAHFLPGWTRGHLTGALDRNSPLQITSSDEADRQSPIVWAIAEARLHKRVLETVQPWQAVPLRGKS